MSTTENADVRRDAAPADIHSMMDGELDAVGGGWFPTVWVVAVGVSAFCAGYGAGAFARDYL
jgi:hypothetical protein